MTWGAPAAAMQSLSGLRVLVVDDEMIIALDIESALADAGAVVVGPVGEITEALALIGREELSAAVLDVRLHGGTVEPIAEALFDRGVPFIFYSGQAPDESSFLRWPKATLVPKPASSRVLTEAVLKAHAAASLG